MLRSRTRALKHSSSPGLPILQPMELQSSCAADSTVPQPARVTTAINESAARGRNVGKFIASSLLDYLAGGNPTCCCQPLLNA